MNGKAIKIIGVAASVVGAVASLAATWAGDKQQDSKIEEKVAKAIADAKKGS